MLTAGVAPCSRRRARAPPGRVARPPRRSDRPKPFRARSSRASARLLASCVTSGFGGVFLERGQPNRAPAQTADSPRRADGARRERRLRAPPPPPRRCGRRTCSSRRRRGCRAPRSRRRTPRPCATAASSRATRRRRLGVIASWPRAASSSALVAKHADSIAQGRTRRRSRSSSSAARSAALFGFAIVPRFVGGAALAMGATPAQPRAPGGGRRPRPTRPAGGGAARVAAAARRARAPPRRVVRAAVAHGRRRRGRAQRRGAAGGETLNAQRNVPRRGHCNLKRRGPVIRAVVVERVAPRLMNGTLFGACGKFHRI